MQRIHPGSGEYNRNSLTGIQGFQLKNFKTGPETGVLLPGWNDERGTNIQQRYFKFISS